MPGRKRKSRRRGRRSRKFSFQISRKFKKKFSAFVFLAGAALLAAFFYSLYHRASVKPPARLVAKPKIVFVIDDMGNTGAYVEEIKKLQNKVTYSILPMLAHTQAFNQLSETTHAEVILHLPLPSVKGTIPGPGLITLAMPDSEVLDVLSRDLASVPHRVGVNNHMGSLGTSDPRLMDLILKELKDRGLFFLDSYTTPKTLGLSIGKKFHLPVLKRDVFLDNEDSQPEIRQQIDRLAAIARSKGYAIGIGHYRFNTLRVLQDEIPRLEEHGFQVVSLKELLRWKR